MIESKNSCRGTGFSNWFGPDRAAFGIYMYNIKLERSWPLMINWPWMEYMRRVGQELYQLEVPYIP